MLKKGEYKTEMKPFYDEELVEERTAYVKHVYCYTPGDNGHMLTTRRGIPRCSTKNCIVNFYGDIRDAINDREKAWEKLLEKEARIVELLTHGTYYEEL